MNGMTALILVISLFFAHPCKATSSCDFVFGVPVSILTEETLRGFGFRFWADMPLGVIKERNGEYAVFGPGMGINAAQMPLGTYKFVGSLDHWRPATNGLNVPRPALVYGGQQPSTDGSDFDIDYAGGGPTYRLPGGALVHIYHGEYHYHRPNGLVWYGSSGMAVSYDDGISFVKIGEILSPHMTKEAYYQGIMQRQQKGGITCDGYMVEADGHGRHINASQPKPDDDYYYILFSDVVSDQRPWKKEGISIARVNKPKALEAIAHRHAPLFRKYYLKDFTEPGIGGRSTFVVNYANHIAQPQVLYCAYLKKYILCYMVDQKKIFLRTSEDLFHWSGPVLAFSAQGVDHVYYPSMLGLGDDPAVLGKEFFLYFVTRPPATWKNAVLKREKITIVPNTI